METRYDYPARQALRGAWMDLLPRTIDPDDRFLYLAGPGNRELPLYLQRGLCRSQLLTCEDDASRFHEVAHHADGVLVVPGNILRAIKFITVDGWPRLRGAWLDFDGNYHTFIEELTAIAAVLPSPRGAVLGVTSFCARDGEALVQGAVNANKFLSGLDSPELFQDGLRTILNQNEELMRLIPEGYSTPDTHAQRELGLLWWIVLMFGLVDLPDKGRYYQFDASFLRRIDQLTSPLKDKVLTAMALRGPDDPLPLERHEDLHRLLSLRKVSIQVTHVARYAFWSQERQPMRTWFIKVQPWPQDLPAPSMQQLLTRVFNLAHRSPLIYIDEHGAITPLTPR